VAWAEYPQQRDFLRFPRWRHHLHLLFERVHSHRPPLCRRGRWQACWLVHVRSCRLCCRGCAAGQRLRVLCLLLSPLRRAPPRPLVLTVLCGRCCCPRRHRPCSLSSVRAVWAVCWARRCALHGRACHAAGNSWLPRAVTVLERAGSAAPSTRTGNTPVYSEQGRTDSILVRPNDAQLSCMQPEAHSSHTA